MKVNIADDVIKNGQGQHFIECRQSVLIDQSKILDLYSLFLMN